MSHHRETVTAIGAPDAVGPYSHAVKAGGLLFISGQIPLDPETGELVERHARRAGAALPGEPRRWSPRPAAARSPTTPCADGIYLTDMSAFSDVNEVYGAYFPSDPPARVAYRRRRAAARRAGRDRRDPGPAGLRGVLKRAHPVRRRDETHQQEAGMQYALTIYDDQSKCAEMPQEDGRAQSEAYGKRDRGDAVGGRVPRRRGAAARHHRDDRARAQRRALVTDGPFAETKEQLGGFYVLDCKDLDEAIEWAAKIPGAHERMRRGSPGHPVRG